MRLAAQSVHGLLEVHLHDAGGGHLFRAVLAQREPVAARAMQNWNSRRQTWTELTPEQGRDATRYKGTFSSVAATLDSRKELS